MDKEVQKREMSMPDYRRIYEDMIMKKCPEKADLFSSILGKKKLSYFDVLGLSTIISGIQKKETVIFNQMHKSYNNETIKEILEYQNNNNLNNSQLAIHFKISRNTIAKWKKIFNQI